MNDSISLDEIDELETAYNNKTPTLDDRQNGNNTIPMDKITLDPNTLTPTHNEHFLQIHGTAMAHTYANIFMAILERKLLKQAPQGLIPIEWIRFIDDVWTHGWTHGLDKLKTFLTYINNLHPTIKFDYTYSAKSVNFLDTTIYINSTGKLESDLYIKPTDRTLLLHQNSFHPQSCKNAIIYNQALRYRRSITDNLKLEQRLNHLLITLIHRGYQHDTITTAFNKALCYTQNELYCTKIKQKKPRTIPSSPYNLMTTQNTSHRYYVNTST